MGKPQNLNQKQASVSPELPRYRLGLTLGVKMKLVKSGISILSSLGLVLVLIPAAHAVFEDPWDYEIPKGSVNVGIKEQNPVQISDLGVHIGKDSRLCDEGVGEGYCVLNDPKVNFQARSILELCPTISSTNCVVGVSFRLPDGTVDEAKFIGYAGGPLFPGNPALNLRRGSQISLWQSSKAIHGGGQSTYMLNAMEYQGFNRSSRKFQSYSLSASVIPYNLIEGSKFRSQQLIEEKKFNADHIWYHQVGEDAGCVWTGDGQCGQRQEFDQNIDISIELRISNQIAGWFSGRLRNPQIEVKKFDSRTNSVKLSAKPVQVARVMKILRPGETSDKLFTALGRHGGATVEQVLEYVDKIMEEVEIMEVYNLTKAVVFDCVGEGVMDNSLEEFLEITEAKKVVGDVYYDQKEGKLYIVSRVQEIGDNLFTTPDGKVFSVDMDNEDFPTDIVEGE